MKKPLLDCGEQGLFQERNKRAQALEASSWASST